jgi:hypothetical protein
VRRKSWDCQTLRCIRLSLPQLCLSRESMRHMRRLVSSSPQFYSRLPITAASQRERLHSPRIFASEKPLHREEKFELRDRPQKGHRREEMERRLLVGSSEPQALFIRIFSFVVLVAIAGAVAVANNGSAARCLRNDRRIMGSDLTRKGLRPAIHFDES